MKKVIQDLAGYVHATLVLAIILPAIYILGMERGSGMEYILYTRCFIVAVPVVLTSFAEKKCKNLFSYIGCGILIFLLTAFLAGEIAKNSFGGKLGQGYCMVILLQTFVLFIDRLILRLYQKRKRDADEAKEEKPVSRALLEKPSLWVLIYFVLIYVLAKNVDSALVCNEALFSCIIYFFAAIIFEYVERTENYLSLNRRVCNLPSRRIYGIGNGVFFGFLLLLVLCILPSALLVEKREYRDFREWVNEREVEVPDWMTQSGQSAKGGGDPMREVMEAQEIKDTPIVLKLFFYAIGVAVFVIIAGIAFRKTKILFLDFRESVDDNGDVVEELEPKEKTVRIKKQRRKKTEQTEIENIRQKYKREIRKHRKDLPECYETPFEIETKAGIAETKEGKELHECYEKARYFK